MNFIVQQKVSTICFECTYNGNYQHFLFVQLQTTSTLRDEFFWRIIMNILNMKIFAKIEVLISLYIKLEKFLWQ